MRVNSPGSCGLAAAGGHSPCAGTSGIGEWNIRVNSPGPDDDGATGGAGGAGGGDCLGPAPTGGIPGTGIGGATGLWNIRVNSPGSDDGVPAATGGTPDA